MLISRACVVWCMAWLAAVLKAQTVHRRFEYKYSFKPPYLAQRDGSVPFWEYGGSKYFVLHLKIYIKHIGLY